MTKQQLINAVEAKIGFHSIIEDAEARDNIASDPVQKRYLYVNHTNADGTMGKTYVYYLHDVINDVASFYNTEAEALDSKEPTSDVRKYTALQNYLKANFNAFFIVRVDLENNWAEADVYTLNTGKLAGKKVLVYKNGNNPIAHLDIV